jgi:hypothetical protein
MTMSTVERKVLGGLIGMMDDDGRVECLAKELAHRIGYKNTGGAITFALLVLEMKNMIAIERKFSIGGRGTIPKGIIRVLAV